MQQMIQWVYDICHYLISFMAIMFFDQGFSQSNLVSQKFLIFIFIFLQCHSSMQLMLTVNCLCGSSITWIRKCRNGNLYVYYTFPTFFELTAKTFWGNWLFILQHIVLCQCYKKSGRQRLTWHKKLKLCSTIVFYLGFLVDHFL